MFRYINILLVVSFLLSSCAGYVVDLGTKAQIDPNLTVECNTSIYGDACNNLEDFILVKKDELDAGIIKKGVQIADIVGTVETGVECSEDGEIGCVSTSEYKAINVNNHKSKIISSETINGIEGEFVIPTPATVIQSASYGVNESISGTIPYCSETGSGCYIKPYSEGVTGNHLKALDYDNINSKTSNIKNGYELVAGIVGTQTLCSGGDNSCYLDPNSFTAVDSSKLIASNIKNGESIGGVTGTYTGDYSDCSNSSHTSCIATESYPSVPTTLTSSLLSSASINGTQGSIENCSAGGSSCYISSATYKAAETSNLIAANIKKDVVIGEVTGTYPSVSTPLGGATNTTDLTTTNFNSLMVSSDSFEWFDSTGNRYTGSGSSDLVATNIKKDVDIFGVTGSYSNILPETKGVGNIGALALKKKDGTVVCLGNSSYGGDCSEVSGLENVVNIFSVEYAFAALKSDGSVVTWGDSSNGGNSSSVSSQLSSGVVNIFSTGSAFAALKENGSVVTWGDAGYGGNSSSVSSSLSSGVINIFSTDMAFAALKSDGSVVTWGAAGSGGNSSSVSSSLSSGVTNIFSNEGAFAALKSDGSVVTWGDASKGGDSSAVATQLSSGVTNIFSTFWGAFAALKEDGSVVTWGYSSYGGGSSSVSAQLSSGVVNIFSTDYAFAALKENGSVVTWGGAYNGGDSSSVSSSLSSGVTNIFSNDGAFAALKSNGSVVTWGGSGGDSSSVSSSLSSGVTNIFSTDYAFAALKSDGSVVTWGDSTYGGDSSAIQEYTGSSTVSDIIKIFASNQFFVGVREDESYVVWGYY